MHTYALGFIPKIFHVQDEPEYILAAMNSCFGLFRPHQHGIAKKQAQVPKEHKYVHSIYSGECARPVYYYGMLVQT